MNELTTYSKELIQKTLDFWGPKYAEKGEKLSEQDAVEILDNLINYVKCLAEFDKNENGTQNYNT